MQEIIDEHSEKLFGGKAKLEVGAAIARTATADFTSREIRDVVNCDIDASGISRLLTELVELGLIERRGKKGMGQFSKTSNAYFDGCARYLDELRKRFAPLALRSGQSPTTA